MRLKDLDYQMKFPANIAVTPKDRHGVLNHRPLNRFFNSLFRLASKKTSKLFTTCLLWGGWIPSQRASNVDSAPISWCHLQMIPTDACIYSVSPEYVLLVYYIDLMCFVLFWICCYFCIDPGDVIGTRVMVWLRLYYYWPSTNEVTQTVILLASAPCPTMRVS